MDSKILKASEVDLNKLSLNGKYISYDGQQLFLKTDFLPAWFSREYHSISCKIPKDSDLCKVFQYIDKLVSKQVPPNFKQTKIVKQRKDESGDTKYDIRPKVKYCDVYDMNKKKLTIDDIAKMKGIECRFIVRVPKINKYNNYFGTNIVALQLQVKESENVMRIPDECCFDE